MNNLSEDFEIEDAIIKLLLTRGQNKTICPSEVTRLLFPDNWREKMGSVRRIANKLVQENIIIITQKGLPVDLNIKGPIRLKLL